MIYYFVILLLALFSIYLQFNPKKSEIKVLSIISFFCILLLGGLRYKVGADWYSYEYIFNETNYFSDVFNAREEKLFMLFLFLIKGIWNNYSFFVFSFFSIAFYLKFKTFIKNSPDIFLSLIIYFYTLFLIYDINGIRQGMAITIVLVSISTILNRQVSLFIFLIIIASLFHFPAIIFLPFYWLAKLKISKNKIIIIISISLILSIPIRIFVGNSQLLQYLLVMPTFSQYSSYVNSEITNKDVSIISVAVLQRIFIFSIFFINYKKIKANEDFKLLLFNGYSIALILFIFLSFSPEFSARLGFYYKSLEIFIIPLIVTSQNRISNKLFLLVVFILLSLYGTYRILEIPDGGLLPYSTCLW